MKRWNQIFIMAVAVVVLLLAAGNIVMQLEYDKSGERAYRVEANRIVHVIEEKGLQGVELEDYQTITSVVPMKEGERQAFLEGGQEDYLIRKAAGTWYRIEYISPTQRISGKMILAMNIILVLMSILILGMLVFVSRKILKPFVTLREVPYELSKGNLTVPVKENKGYFFGRFVWGINLLRENLEEQKQRELRLQKEKRTLILSIFHDIKTPLSAIKLYAKVLSRDLYKGEEKQHGIAESINRSADEIEQFISQIMQASREDFLRLEVQMGEFYLSELMGQIRKHYKDTWELLDIRFEQEHYADCILKGDLDRSIEVFQNVLENAIKYGDGNDIRIVFTREEGCQLITVRNTGCMLPENEIPHIFESFWRGSNVKSNRGSGLGLYIAKQLMQKMGGEIYAEIEENEMCVTAVFVRA